MELLGFDPLGPIDSAIAGHEVLKIARQMYGAREHTGEVIAQTLGVSRKTIYRDLKPEAASR